MPRELIDNLSEGKWLRVQEETWGHLKAKPGHHRGWMVFTCGEYGDLISVRSDFKSVPASPWFFQSHEDFICENATERGKLYLFVGEYVRRTGDDCGHFVGKVTEINPVCLLNAELTP